MAANPNDPAGIYVPIELDTSKAVKQFEEFGETVKKAELRPNTDLDDFFAGVQSNAKGAGEAIKKFQLDMRTLSQTAKSLGGSISSSGAMTEAERNRARAGQYRMPSLSGATPFSMNMGKLGQTAKDSTAAQAAEKLAHVEEYRTRMGTLSGAAPFHMNMGSLAQSAYKFVSPMERPPARSNEYNRYVGNEESGKKSSYENRFQNRYLSGEIASGALQKQITSTIAAERESRKLQVTQDKLLSQSRLMYRQTRYGRAAGYLAHAYGENQGAISAGGSMAGSVGKYAGLGVAGLVTSGFTGTTEGERFARELRVLSLELAASFKPLMDGFTNLTRGARQWLQTLSPEGQDRLQTAGATAGGAYLGYRIAGAPGAVVGAAIGFGVSEASIQSAKDEQQKSKEFNRDKYMLDMKPEERLKEIEKRKKQVDEDYRKESNFWTFDNTEVQDRKTNRDDVLREMRKQAKREIDIKKKKDAGMPLSEAEQEIFDQSKSNPNRRQLLITEGTGFAGVGDTFRALQEDVLRTAAEQKSTTDGKLDDIKDELKDLNQNVKALNQ